MEPDDLLCSRNARPPKDARGQAPILLARRAPTIKRWSLDARSKGQPWPFPLGQVAKFGRPSPGLMARLGESIAKQSEGRAGKKDARRGRSISPHP